VILGKYSKSGTPDDTIYLKAYTGDPVKVDRMNGTSLRLESPCLSVLWLTQPAKLTMLLTEGALAESGFLPRFLLMQIPKEEKPRHMDPAAPPDNLQKDVQVRYDQAIQTLMEAYLLKAGDPFTIEPTPEAVEQMIHFHNAMSTKAHYELQDVASYVQRWAEQAWRIAVGLHAGRWMKEAPLHALELRTVQDAIELCEWFAEQQLAVIYPAREKTQRRRMDEVLGFLADHPAGITPRDVQRRRLADNAHDALALLQEMEKQGKLKGEQITPAGGGRSSWVFKRGRQE